MSDYPIIWLQLDKWAESAREKVHQVLLAVTKSSSPEESVKKVKATCEEIEEKIERLKEELKAL